MASCCDPGGFDTEFNAAFARRLAKRYRRKGVDPTARRIVEALTDRGVDGATVLEIGGGMASKLGIRAGDRVVHEAFQPPK